MRVFTGISVVVLGPDELLTVRERDAHHATWDADMIVRDLGRGVYKLVRATRKPSIVDAREQDWHAPL